MANYSTVSEVRQRLADIQGGYTSGSVVHPGITGIPHAHAHAPKSIDMDVPCIINFAAGPAQYEQDEAGADYVIETREYPFRLYAKRKGEGIDGEAETETEKLIEAIRDTFFGRPSLSLGIINTNLKGVLRSMLLDDTGIKVFEYSGQEYLGVGFNLSVTQVIPRIYTPGE